MTINEKLLAAIKARKAETKTPFGQGIITADRYVKTVLDCVGSDLCYRYAATKETSFDDVLKKASQKLVYRNEDMDLLAEPCSNSSDMKAMIAVGDNEVDLPKNTLMVFKHVLTTPRKDRDGDILRTEGARVDEKMLLLWQHIHTLPIGKMLLVAEHNAKRLSLISAIVDLNELSHDAAVMVDNDMARFSHGFAALKFEELKEQEGETTGWPGFDVKEFEIMEESVVSVPSNKDAEVEEIILGLVEGEKLTSGMMKEYGAQIREKRPLQTQSMEIPNEDEQFGSDEEKGTGCRCGGKETDAPEQKDGSAEREAEGEKDAKDSEVKGTTLFYPGQLTESWENIQKQLDNCCSQKLRDEGHLDHRYCWRVATFNDHAIFCCEDYSAGGTDEYKYCKVPFKMNGEIAEVSGECTEIELKLSIEEAKSASPYTKEKSGETEEKEITAQEAIGVVFAKGTEQQLKHLRIAIETNEKAKQKAKRKAAFRKLMR